MTAIGDRTEVETNKAEWWNGRTDGIKFCGRKLE